MSEGQLGSMVFFSLGWEGDSPTRDRFFFHIKGIKIFGYEIVIEKESEKISKFSKK